MNTQKRCIVTVQYDVSDCVANWQTMTDDQIKEYFGDTPEVLADCDFYFQKSGENIIKKVERL